MTTALYAAGKRAFLKGEADLSDGTFSLVPVLATYAPNMTTDLNLEDIDEAARATDPELVPSTSFTLSGGKVYFDAGDVTFPAVPSGDDIVGFVGFMDTGDESTSTLIGYFDNFANLPITPDTRDIVAAWAEDTNKVFSW